MSKKERKDCRYCEFAEWPKDKAGRNNYRRTGYCTFKFVMPAIPDAVARILMQRFWGVGWEKLKDKLESGRYMIYDGCGEDCECFKRKA